MKNLGGDGAGSDIDKIPKSVIIESGSSTRLAKANRIQKNRINMRILKVIAVLFASLFVGCASNQGQCHRRGGDGKGVCAPRLQAPPPCYQDVEEPPREVITRVHVPPPIRRVVYIRDEEECPPPIRYSPCPQPMVRFAPRPCPRPSYNRCPPQDSYGGGVRIDLQPPPHLRYNSGMVSSPGGGCRN